MRTLFETLSCVGKKAWIEPKQLLQFGLFHGDPHPGNIFALADGRIAYVDFGNVAEVSQQNKQTLIDAVVHAVNEDYEEMAKDFIKLVRPAAVSFALGLVAIVEICIPDGGAVWSKQPGVSHLSICC